MKRILPIIFAGFGVLLLFFLAYFPVYAQTSQPGLTADQLENVDDRWIIDPEVTAIGKNASRSGLLLDWALRDYNWSYVNPGTTHPLLPFWVTLRNFVYSFMIVVVVVAAIVMLVTRGRSLTIQRFFPRFIIVAILVTFSFSLVQVLYELVDIFQGFFVRPNSIPISQRDLLFIGWNYNPFVGLRLLGDSNFEAAFTTLLFVKLTTFTYYVMVGMLLIRKVILWFFIIISPFFPLLLFFYPLRNTAKIWIGEFFRWLLYAPLFAIFLAALVAMWRTGIPLSFNFGGVNSASSIIFPTAVSILLGGPGQAVGQLNNLNIIDTYAQYLVALMMLWGVIIVPWILLQIFLDYVSNLNIQNAPLLQNFSKYMSRPPLVPAPSMPPQGPVPPGSGAGRERSIPIIKDFKIPTITGLARPIPTGSSITAKQITNMAIPTLRDIARYESNAITNSEKTREEAQRVRETLTKIANPANITTQTERSEFERMRETLRDQSLKGDKLAQSLLQAATTYSESQETTNTTQNSVNTVINQLANPQTVTDRVEREKIERVRESVRIESGKNNQLANVLSQVTSSTSSISNVLESLSKNTEKTKVLKERIEKESKEGNSFASTILSSIQSMQNSERVIQTLMNIHQPARVENSLSRQEYKHVSDTIQTEKQKGNEFATHLTEKLERLSSETRVEEKEKLISEIRESVIREQQAGNPLAGLILNQVRELADKREDTSIATLRDQFDKEVKEGNPLAVELSALATKKELTEEEVKDLETKVEQAKQTGDPLGVLLSELLARRQKALEEETKPHQTPLPRTNRIQQVSLDDYEAVKKMWTDNYENLEVSGVEGVSGRTAWIKDDIKQITDTIDLLSSNDEEQVKAGMDKVSDILPFLLIGGFSQNEITAYLKAKLEAAKGVLTQIEKTTSAEDTQVYVEKKKTQEPKQMTMTQHVSSRVTEPVLETSSTTPLPQAHIVPTQTYTSPQTSESLLRLANITMPDLKRVAQYDRMMQSEDKKNHPDIRLFEDTLLGIASPETAKDSEKREYYTSIREKLLQESKAGNIPAASVLRATEAATIKEVGDRLDEFVRQLALISSLQQNRATAPISEEEMKKFKERISFDVSRGSEFAKKLQRAITDQSVMADPLQKAALTSEIAEAVQAGDSLAESFTLLSKKVSSPESEEYVSRLLRTHELLQASVVGSSIDSSKAGVIGEIVEKLNQLKAENNPEYKALFDLLSRVETQGFDLKSVVQAENLFSSQSEIIKVIPEIQQYLDQFPRRRTGISDIVTSVSRPLGPSALPPSDVKTLQNQVEKSADDPFVKKLRAWGEKLSDSELEAVGRFLREIDDKAVFSKDSVLQKLRSDLETRKNTDSFAKAVLSLAQGMRNQNLTLDHLRQLLPTLLERVGRETVQGNPVAFQVQELLIKKLEEKHSISLFHRLLTSLSDPSHVTGEMKERVTALRTLLVSEKGKGNTLATSLTAMVSSVIGGDVSKTDDAFAALYEQLLLQKEKQNDLAVAFVTEIEKLRESETLLDLGEVLKNLSSPDTLPQGEKELYLSLMHELEKASSNGDATAMSILSAVEIVRKQGVDLAEARKIRDALMNRETSYSKVLTEILQSSILTRSSLDMLLKILMGISKNDPEVSDIKDSMTKEDEAVPLFEKTLKALLTPLNVEKRQELLVTLRGNLIHTQEKSPLSKAVLSKMKAYKSHVSEDEFVRILNLLAFPERIQIISEREEIEKLREKIEASPLSNDFSKLMKGIIELVRNQQNSQSSNTVETLTEAFIANEAANGNSIASTIFSRIRKSSEISESEIRSEIEKEAQKGNPVAQCIITMISASQPVVAAPEFPKENTLQQVSLEDYESVKRMWIEGYKQLEAPGSRTRDEWLGDEVSHIDQTINLLTSSVKEDKEKGMQNVSHILPFLLIGGFTQTQVISYLKAKLEAAKTVYGQLHEQDEEASRVPTGERRVTTQAEKQKEIAADE